MHGVTWLEWHGVGGECWWLRRRRSSRSRRMSQPLLGEEEGEVESMERSVILRGRKRSM